MNQALVGLKDKVVHWLDRALHSPFGFQYAALSLLVLLLSVFEPTYLFVNERPFGEDYTYIDGQQITIREIGFLDNYAHVHTAGFEEVEAVDEEGNVVVQMLPKKRSEIVSYTVRAGDNVSKIAHKFGLKVSTILWANQLTSKETLQVNQKLKIPPTDGIFYTVRERDTLGEIVKNYDIEMAKVLAYNNFNDDRTIQVGQQIFLPSAQKRFIAPNVITSASQPTVLTPVTAPSGEVTSLGISLLRPTKGTLTQGYHRSHYGIDIGNIPDTPIYASADGTVTTSDDGWNYGYGNYVIIDHGNGVETLYGHMKTREVAVGQYVKRGQLVGRMGNTGRVFGPTGVHLHFELRIRGRKVNPNNYF